MDQLSGHSLAGHPCPRGSHKTATKPASGAAAVSGFFRAQLLTSSLSRLMPGLKFHSQVPSHECWWALGDYFQTHRSTSSPHWKLTRGTQNKASCFHQNKISKTEREGNNPFTDVTSRLICYIYLKRVIH